MEPNFLQEIEDFELGTEDSLLSEVYLADGDIDKGDNGLFWKEILREGEWAYRPGPGQKPVPVPLRVIPGKSSSSREIGMADLVEAFNDGAIDHVTVPTSHDDKPHDNTGYVRELKIVEKNGKNYLSAGIEFTEPDIAGKVERKSIANTSAGIIFDYVKKDSGKKYRMALGHVALTNKPWINGMTPFGENFSEDEIVSFQTPTEGQEQFFEMIEEYLEFKDFTAAKRKKLAGKGHALPDGSFPIENEQDLKNAIAAFGRAKDKAAAKRHIIKRAKALGKVNLLPEAWRVNLSTDNENALGGKEMGEVEEVTTEETAKDKTTSNDPAPETVLSDEAREALKAELSEDFKTQLAEKDAEKEALRKKVHAMSVDKRIDQLKEEGFSEYPGLLKEIRAIMLADSEQETLTLSEEGEDGNTTEVKLSVTGAIERIIAALPKEDGKVRLSEQANSSEDHNEPKVKVDEEVSLEDRAAAAAKDLGLSDPVFEVKKDGDA